MAKIYWKYVKNGTKKFNEIPEKIQEEVKALALEELETGELTQEDFHNLIG